MYRQKARTGEETPQVEKRTDEETQDRVRASRRETQTMKACKENACTLKRTEERAEM
jgi:hypothetical protein